MKSISFGRDTSRSSQEVAGVSAIDRKWSRSASGWIAAWVQVALCAGLWGVLRQWG